MEKARKRFGDDFDEEKFVTTHPNVVRYKNEIDTVHARFVKALEENDRCGFFPTISL